MPLHRNSRLCRTRVGQVARPTTAHRRTRLTAFTLMELLIVIVVIGLLTALLMPALASAREHARKTRCASNMKQVALGMTMYLGDHDERFPATINETYDLDRAAWGQLVEPYVHNRKLFRCPSLGPTANEGIRHFNYFQFFITIPFGYNQTYLGHPDRPMTMAKVKNPAETVLLADSKNDFSERGGQQHGWFEIYAPSTGVTEAVALRHSRGANVVFVDTRVDWMLSKQILKDDRLWDLE